MTLEYILNEPLMMENDGKLTKREYTLLLEHNMSNMSKMQWWMPLISSYPNYYSKVAVNKLFLVENATELIEMHYRLMESI